MGRTTWQDINNIPNIPLPGPRTPLPSIQQAMILTNDPSFTAWGWAVINANNDEIVRTGCIKTDSNAKKLRIRKGDDRVRRINEIGTELLEIIHEHNVKFIVCELPHGSQNAAAAVMMGASAAIMELISITQEIPIDYYSEADAKKALLGKSSASKMETMRKIDVYYLVPVTKGIGKNRKGEVVSLWNANQSTDEAIADAIQVYHCAKKNSQILKMLKR